MVILSDSLNRNSTEHLQSKISMEEIHLHKLKQFNYKHMSVLAEVQLFLILYLSILLHQCITPLTHLSLMQLKNVQSLFLI
jgi:hypothetical protein